VPQPNESSDLFAYAVALADDALVHAQRLAEWVSRAPTLEEELALANVALDHIGRARLFYARALEAVPDGRSEDDLAYHRDADAFMNATIYELPRGDFAFAVARQFLTDAFAVPFLEALAGSRDAGLAAIAEKAVKESTYHLRRSRDWMLRLGDGTEESRARVQTAIDALWGHCGELFEPFDAERRLLARGIAVDRAALRARWREDVHATLAEATLHVPPMAARSGYGGRVGRHTPHLETLLADMQVLQRAHPGQQW
jgi:ring-1,2-phenylacetyl-CoA epoxidase subunit PaaC